MNLNEKNRKYQDDAMPLFLSFCIEQYKNAKGICGEEAMKKLVDTGALKYLKMNYEVIHTQSPQWILEEIEEYIIKQSKR